MAAETVEKVKMLWFYQIHMLLNQLLTSLKKPDSMFFDSLAINSLFWV